MKSDQTRAMTAVLISGIILFAWQFYFAPPKKTQVTNEVVTTKETNKSTKINTAAPIEPIAPKNTPNQKEELFSFNSGDFKYELNNRLDIKKASYKNTSANELFQQDSFLQRVQFIQGNISAPQIFTITKNSENNFTASNPNIVINISLEKNGLLNFKTTKNVNFTHIKYIFPSKSMEKNNVHFSKFTYLTNKSDLEELTIGDEESIQENLQWFGNDYYYHTLTRIVGKDSPSKIVARPGEIESQFEIITPIKENTSFIFVKKTYDQLIKIGKNLHFAVDFGFFSIIAIPVLRGLQYFYSMIGNWGWAIVLLTLLIRLLTFPLQYISTKNMAKMKKIQPEIDRIKKKYKDDPAKMQKETMMLFKKAGTNPLSGCFPMLLQMPIFFAFYKVLYNAVELVDAPWIGWVKDLSEKDPYYILPVLMGLAMFAQQKITPTTGMDKTQAKVMMFLPLIFAFIMKDLPSGLNLYIFISTLFGIALHFFVLKRVK